MITVYSPLTWGIYDKPPPDIPECGFLGKLCPPSARGRLSPLYTNNNTNHTSIYTMSQKTSPTFLSVT